MIKTKLQVVSRDQGQEFTEAASYGKQSKNLENHFFGASASFYALKDS